MSKQIPQVVESNKFNFFTSIWIVPFIALLIAGWLAYQYFSELGPEIRIILPKNEGLQAGQSHIKYRNIPVGTVKKIKLQQDGKGIVVVARMDKSVSPFLNDSAKFWIVKPEVSIGGVSGLDTLISGTYINMHAGKSENAKKEFVGQSHAYRDDSSGRYFVLNSALGNNAIKTGTPVYFKNIKVGQVEYVVLALDNASVDIIVYIEDKYTPYIQANSNFWVRSTFEASLNNGRVDFSVAPVTDLIQGAIEFTSEKKGLKCTVPDAFVFTLHNNKSAIENTHIGKSKPDFKIFKIYTDEPIARLNIGAPVRYEGFEVGKVKEVKIFYDNKKHKMQSDVSVAINLSVFANSNDIGTSTGKTNFYNAVKEGLRAQIIPSDPILGFLYVDLSFIEGEANQSIEYKNAFNVLPSVTYRSGNMMASLTKIIDKINGLPLNKLVDSLNTILENSNKVALHTDKVVQGVNKPLVSVLTDLKKTVKNLNTMSNKKTFSALPNVLDKTLKELTVTLQTTKKVVGGYGNHSLINRQLSDTLKIVTKTSKEMQLFLKMLNRKPNSLIFGDK